MSCCSLLLICQHLAREAAEAIYTQPDVQPARADVDPLEAALKEERETADALAERLAAHEAKIRKAENWGRGALWMGAAMIGLVSQFDAIRDFLRKLFAP